MKTLIASDIHGSGVFCAQLIDRYYSDECDNIILLGDILYHGPRNDLPAGYSPKKVISLLNPLAQNIICVRGNCDAEVDGMVLDFDVLTDSRDICLGGIKAHLAHGHHDNIDNPPEGQYDVFLSGHTHIPLCAEKCGILFINPGSVAIPKEGSPNSYAVFDSSDGKLIWKTLGGLEYMSCRL